MIAIDLFCGRGGWTNGLIAAGFKVYGFDINPQPEYKGIFVKRDILELTPDYLLSFAPDFAVCSSPCEQFSVHCMKHFHPNPPYPEMGIKLFNHARMLLEELGVPYVMENVRCAEKFVGKAVNHCGPFYLWGNAVPPLLVQGVRKAQDLKAKYLPTPEMLRRGLKTEMFHIRSSMPAKTRSGLMAEIPLELANCVADYAERILEVEQ